MFRAMGCVASLLLMPISVHAQINLAWQRCIAITGGANTAKANWNYACDGSAPDSQAIAVMSFVAEQSITDCVGMSAVIEVLNDGLPNVADFWRYGVGQCREGSLHYPVSLSGLGNTTTCRNPWQNAATTGTFVWTSPGLGRERGEFHLDSNAPISLSSGQQYIAGAFAIDFARDSGPGSCESCLSPACINLVRMELLRSDHDPIVMTAAALRNQIYWQGGAVIGNVCITPVSGRTWGSIKSLYR